MKVTRGPQAATRAQGAVSINFAGMKFVPYAVLACLLLAALVSAPVSAASAVSQAIPQVAQVRHLKVQPLATVRVQNKGISKNEAATLVKKRFGGKILAISEVQRKGKSMFRVKGLSDKSQVYVVFVDRQSGRISR
uniref:PepSY domain-containing protein n=1 Tax=Microbulbifer agarilyticus TaxID=260552 RepID=UPI0011103AE7|nr:PepSY domain-containing protein [Microbulbifer agarilyticus]